MDQPSKDELSMLTRVNLIFRFSYTIPFLLASVCGVVYAVPYDVPWHIMVLIPVAVLLLALFVNFSNDYFDHKSGVDKKVNDRKSRTRDNLMTSDAVKRVYWEGNQFDTGLVTERQGKAIMAALLVLIVIVALPVIAYGGWSVVVLGLIGAALAFFYTAPPVNLGARGLGEVSVAISFFMMCFCSFYVATGTFTVEILLFSVMIGIIVGLMRLIDSMSANDVHLEMHEVNMSIRLGTEGTVRAIKAVDPSDYRQDGQGDRCPQGALGCRHNPVLVPVLAADGGPLPGHRALHDGGRSRRLLVSVSSWIWRRRGTSPGWWLGSRGR